MASGFDATSFNTGLLNSIASQNNAATRNAQEELRSGDAEQVRAFQEAAHEAELEKKRKADLGTKMDALANIISNGAPNPAAYAVARDAVEGGYTNSEHLPYVMEAYKSTLKDYMDNPEKWTGVKQSADPEWDQKMGDMPPQDTNPGQTAALRRSGNQQDISDIENIRQRNVPNPHGELPGGKWSSDMSAIFAGDRGKSEASTAGRISAETSPEAIQGEANKTYANTTASQQAQLDAEKSRSSELAKGLNIGGDQTAQAPVSAAMPGQQQAQGANPLAISSSELSQVPNAGGQSQAPAQPPSTQQMASAQPSPGIQLSGPPPADTSQLGQSTPDMAQQQAPNAQQPGPTQAAAVQIDPHSHLNEQYLSTIKDPISNNMVRMIANYDILPPNQSLRPDAKGEPSPMFEYMIAAKKANPDFSMTNYKALVGLKSQYIDPNGVAQKQYQAIGTGLSHLGMLQQAGQQLNNTDVQAINTIANKAGAQVGETPLVTYNNIVSRLAPEIVSSYVAGGGTEIDRTEAQKNLASSLSGPQREAALSATAHLLYGKIMPLQNTWDQNFPNEAGKDFLPPNAHAVLKGLGVDESDKTPYLTAQNAHAAAHPAQNSGSAPDFSHLWSQ